MTGEGRSTLLSAAGVVVAMAGAALSGQFWERLPTAVAVGTAFASFVILVIALLRVVYEGAVRLIENHADQVLQKHVDSLGERIDRVGEKVDGLGGRIDSVGEKVDGLGERIDSVGEKVDGLGERIDGVGEKIDHLAVEARHTARTMLLVARKSGIGSDAAISQEEAERAAEQVLRDFDRAGDLVRKMSR